MIEKEWGAIKTHSTAANTKETTASVAGENINAFL
jgi:hypothetical protein